MKIPDSIRINGVEYEIVYVPNLRLNDVLAFGVIDYNDAKISISTTDGTEHQRRCQTLWHEILHGIRNENGLVIENEEAVVEMFAKGIYQVLQDNGKRLFDIKESEQNE